MLLGVSSQTAGGVSMAVPNVVLLSAAEAGREAVNWRERASCPLPVVPRCLWVRHVQALCGQREEAHPSELLGYHSRLYEPSAGFGVCGERAPEVPGCCHSSVFRHLTMILHDYVLRCYNNPGPSW